MRKGGVKNDLSHLHKVARVIFSRISSDPCLKSRGSNPHCGLKGHAQSEPCCLIWGEAPSLSKCCHAHLYLFPCAKLLPAVE